ncbi:MAG: biopolymer transporter ExbD [Gammaproteobacteria bacterium]|nr:MAG: biopolymer transporter ExbD [Gammaproteobacteria bacterium]
MNLESGPLMRKHPVQVADDEADIDMTPMLDVVFIMLIFFIVTASFVKERALDMSSPDNDNPPPPSKEDNTILVRIEESGRIWVEDTPTDVGGVQPNVKRLIAQNPKAKVVIQPDPKSKADYMLRVLDQSRAAGAEASIAAIETGP